MPTILLIRHGENDTMQKHLASRLPDVHLNEKGRAQALRLASFLADRQINAIYSSPLERAQETAQPLSTLKKIPIQMHEGLSEVDFGSWQGQSYKKLYKKKIWKLVIESPAEVVFPDGESYQDAQKRVVSTIEDILRKHDKKDTIACFTHADVIRLLVIHYLGMLLDNLQRLQMGTATITELNVSDQKIIITMIGQNVY